MSCQTLPGHHPLTSDVAPRPRRGPHQLARAVANSDADELLALIGNAGALGWEVLWIHWLSERSP